MGSYRSGPSQIHAGTVEHSYVLDLVQWQRKGLLVPGSFVTWHWSRGGKETGSIGATLSAEPGDTRVSTATLIYRAGRDDQWEDVREPIRIMWTPCRFGGVRPWFVCPGGTRYLACDRRVLKLYAHRDGLFVCRQCADLTYQSQREPAQARGLTRAQTIRRRLGGSGSMAEPFPPKPQGMHWRTYERLYREAEAGDQVHLAWLDGWLRRSDRRIERLTQRSRR